MCLNTLQVYVLLKVKYIFFPLITSILPIVSKESDMNQWFLIESFDIKLNSF